MLVRKDKVLEQVISNEPALAIDERQDYAK
jgi:hypothetical protein